MSTTRHILQSEVGYDLTTGKYVLSAVFSGTEKYWTGSAWSATFASANQYTWGTGTLGGQDTWTWIIPTDLTTSGIDDNIVRVFGWESGITVALASQVILEEFDTSQGGFFINALTGQPTDDGFLPDTDLFTDQNSQFSFIFADLEDSDGNPVNMTGHSIVARFWRNGKSTVDFTGTVTVSSTDGNDLTMTGSSTGSGLFRYALWDSTSSVVRQHGTLNVLAAPAST